MRGDIMSFYSYEMLLNDIENLENSALPFKSDTLCFSYLERAVPMLTVGHGKRHVLYVGAHHGMESISSAVIMKFCKALAEAYENGGFKLDNKTSNKLGDKINKETARLALEKATFYVIPMLNPDGVTLSVNGIDEALSLCSGEKKEIYRKILMRANKERDDFSRWQANGRGVDLNHNYSCGFSEYKRFEMKNKLNYPAPTRYSGIYPESEVEASSLCNLVRNIPFSLMLTFHSQGEVLYGDDFSSQSDCDKVSRLGRFFEKTSGYKRSTPEGSAAYGGFTDWFLPTTRRPAYTVELGIGENPLPLHNLKEIFKKMFFPMLTLPMI
jgi:g-D-glutamyl-meso-diaminopimelate peptidase